MSKIADDKGASAVTGGILSINTRPYSSLSLLNTYCGIFRNSSVEKSPFSKQVISQSSFLCLQVSHLE